MNTLVLLLPLLFSSSSSSSELCVRDWFTVDLSGWKCADLVPVSEAQSPGECADACCAASNHAGKQANSCYVWQWSEDPALSAHCWINHGMKKKCSPASGWTGSARVDNQQQESCGHSVTGINLSNANSMQFERLSLDECCEKCFLAHCDAWTFDESTVDGGGHCNLKTLSRHPPQLEKREGVHYGFGPATDCVTIATHICDSVKGCAAFGLGASADTSGSLFTVELYACTQGMHSKNGWTVYRKQEKYLVPFEGTQGDAGSCTTILQGVTSFKCNQPAYADGLVPGLGDCSFYNGPRAHWKLSDIDSTHLGTSTPFTADDPIATKATNSTLASTTLRFPTTSTLHTENPPACHLAGVWQSTAAMKYEIRYESGNGLSMLALSPTGWLTARATYTVDNGEGGDGLLRLLAVYDNGKTQTGLVSASCESIHWGAEVIAAGAKYAWASPCNDSDATQVGWSLEALPSITHAHVLVKYASTSFTGCLDRSQGWLTVSRCTGLAEQRFLKVPAGNGICSSMREGTNCPGNNIAKSSLHTSPEECCAFCKSIPGCTAWTFNGQEQPLMACFAKSQCPHPYINKTHTSGVAPAPSFALVAEDDPSKCVDIKEHSATACKVLTNTQISDGTPTPAHPDDVAVTNYQNCSDLCSKDIDCIAWQFNKPSWTSCVLQPGIDFYGGDGSRVGAHSPEECCKFCEANTNTVCRFFVFNPTKVFGNGSEPRLKICELKKTMSPTPTPDCKDCKVVPNPGRISGLLPPPPSPSPAPFALADNSMLTLPAPRLPSSNKCIFILDMQLYDPTSAHTKDPIKATTKEECCAICQADPTCYGGATSRVPQSPPLMPPSESICTPLSP
jgi:hypothetical protein